MGINTKNTNMRQRWRDIKRRCLNIKYHRYKNYGGRGIQICDHWLNYDNFINDVGFPPDPSYSLDRIDNNGNYEPGNVRWATMKEQHRNRSTNTFITLEGKTLCIKDWALLMGLKPNTLIGRLYTHGWPIEKAILQPTRKYRSTSSV